MAGSNEPIELELDVHPDVLLDDVALREHAARFAGLRADVVGYCELLHRAIDARRGRVRVHLRVRLHSVAPVRESFRPAHLPRLGPPEVAIVGAGPAGLFCAWRLARAGVAAHVFERGKKVRARRHDLAALTTRGRLDPESNYCFGEGGAGTFSDGKLYTRSSKRGSVREVLETFVAYGAPERILVDARPHIGTNRLPAVIGSMREHLEAVGVRFCFSTRVDGLLLDTSGRVGGVRLADGSEASARATVLASGHSAPDVIAWLHLAGVELAFKPFAMGVRIEHPQAFVDRMQYGTLAGHSALGSAPYRFVEQIDGCGVFSFCMCPGGFIVPASTREGAQVVNGWSPASRRGRFANSGFVSEVGEATLARAGLDPTDPLAGMAYQDAIERRAHEAGGGAFVAPAQRLADLIEGVVSTELPRCSYPRGLAPAPLHELLAELSAPIRAALARIGQRLPGFLGDDAVAVGVESRTSSAVRIVRDPQTCASPSRPGLYPCGEGGGHAGGIMSAALDGIRVAEAILHGIG